MDGFDPETATTILEHCQQMTSPFGMAQIRVLGGAMARVPFHATAFAHRDKSILIMLINAWEDPATADRHVA